MKRILIFAVLLLFVLTEIAAQRGSRSGSHNSSRRAAIGNRSVTVTITPDTIKPVVTDFIIPATSDTLQVAVTTFTASDNKAVTGYKITESSTQPLAGDLGWTGVKPTYFNFVTEGIKTLYAWVKDAAGNVSTSLSDGVVITLPDTGAAYYVSNTGSDSNDGLTPETAFATIDKVNTLNLSGSIRKVIFNRGDEWEGTITVGYSGSGSDTIEYGAYGTGANPKIYGSEVITGWTLHSGNIYKATFTTDINQLFVNDERMQAARWPETGFATVDAAPTTSSLTDSELNGSLDYTGTICLIHSSSYGLDRRTVTSSSSTTLTLNSAPYGDVSANEKYILVGKLEFLTVAGRWFYDDNTNTVYLWKPDGTEPTDTEVRGSTLDYGLFADGKDYVTVKNIEFLQQKINGVYFTNSDYFTVNNVVSKDADAVGIRNYLGHHGTIEYCTVTGANHYGIEQYNSTGNSQTNHNNVSKIALFDNLGLSGIGNWWMGSGIFAQNSNTTTYQSGQINHIRYNRVDSVGYNGIHFANEGQVEYNYITYCGFSKNDGGFVYTSGGYPPNVGINQNSIIRYNIGLYGYGIGSAPYFEGVYADEYSEGVTIEYNTVGYVSRGLFLHRGNNHVARYNNIFNAENGLYISLDGDAITMTNNIVYGLSNQEVIHLNLLTGTPVINSNTYINKYTANPFELDWTTYYTFANWKTTTGYDAASTFDNTALPTGYSEKLVVNPTDSTKSFHLNYATGVKNAVTGTDILEDFTVPAYNSIIVTGYGVTSIADSVVTYETPVDFGFNSSVYSLVTSTTTRRAMPIVMPENGMITSISFYHDGGTGTCLVGVYNSTGTVPNQRLGISAETAINVSAGWNTVDLITPVFVEEGTQVWLAVVPSIGGMHYEAGTPYRANATSSVYAHGLPMSFDDGSTVTVASYRQNIYCTYLKQ